MTTAALNSYIDNVIKIEAICDEVLEVLYYKHGTVPRNKHIRDEIEMLRSKDKLLKADELFLDMLVKTRFWFVKVPTNEYLEMWTYERNLPYERIRA